MFRGWPRDAAWDDDWSDIIWGFTAVGGEVSDRRYDHAVRGFGDFRSAVSGVSQSQSAQEVKKGTKPNNELRYFFTVPHLELGDARLLRNVPSTTIYPKRCKFFFCSQERMLWVLDDLEGLVMCAKSATQTDRKSGLR